MNQTIFENLPQKMNLISDLFSRVVFRDKEACQDLVRIILGEDYEVTGVTSQYDITNLQYRTATDKCGHECRLPPKPPLSPSQTHRT